MEIDLLGPVSMRASGAEVPLRERRQRAVLAILAGAVPPHRTVTQMIDDLWGDDPPASARNAVQVYVTGLRKALGPSGIEVRHVGDGYELRGSSLSVDVVTFEAGVAEGRAALRLGDSQRAAEVLAKALSLWQGEPYAGLADLPFARRGRDVLRATRTAASHDLAVALSREGRPQEAIEVSRSLLADDPYDEAAWGSVARNQYWAGHQQDALQTCRQARRRLSQDLGIDPTPALAGLESQILKQEVPPPVVAKEQVAAPAALPRPPEIFLGREEVVQDILQQIESGARVVSVTGLGGIGKSAVAIAVAHECRRRGRPVWFCPLEMESRADTAVLKGRHAAGLDATHDSWSAAQGGLLILDNIEQIADMPSAVAAIVRRADAPQILVTTRVAMHLREERLVIIPPLEGGAGGPAEELFVRRAGRHGRSWSDHDRGTVLELCEALGGLPLALEFAAARTRIRTPEQLLRQLHDQAEVSEGGDLLDVPERQRSVRQVLKASVDLLSEPARVVLVAASQCEGWSTSDLLERTCTDQLAIGFEAALDELTTSGIGAMDPDGRVRVPAPVRRHVQGSPEGPGLRRAFIRATHDLVRETAPQLIGRSAAASLLRLQQDDDALTTAMAANRADGHVTLAGQLAIQLPVYWLMTGRFRQAQQLLTELAQSAVPADLRAQLRVINGTFASYLTQPDAIPTLQTALEEAQQLDLDPDRVIVNGWCSLAAMHVRVEDHAAALAASEQAQLLAQRSGDPELIALSCDLAGFVAAHMHDNERALQANLAGIRDSRRDGDDYRLAGLLAAAADNLAQLSRYDEAGAVMDEAFQIAGRVDLGPLTPFLLLGRGQTLACDRRLSEAIPTLVEALRTGQDLHPDPALFADALFLLAGCETIRHQDPLAARLYGAADAWYAEVGLTFAGRTAQVMVDLRAELVDRMGADTFGVYQALGHSRPQEAISGAMDSGRALAR